MQQQQQVGRTASGQPVIVINQNTEREHGRKAQLGNIQAAKSVADIVRTCLGPKAMLKMLLSQFGIVMTNDGNAILREIEVSHPAAKSMIELSRAQDEEVGDGTTSVIILAGEMLAVAEPWLSRDMHPIVINRAFLRALDDALAHMKTVARDVQGDRASMLGIVQTCIGTKYIAKWSGLMCNIALDAVLAVSTEEHGERVVDTKRYLRVEKVPGGEISDSCVVPGVIVNKDVTHAGMRRRIENPRILLLDCPLEYKKGESQTDIELEKAGAFDELLRIEEEHIREMCDQILAFKPDLVITEKGLCDLAQHFFVKAGVTALRRFRKSITNRIARATGATIVSRPDEIRESDIGTGCGLFEVRQVGDEYVRHSQQQQQRATIDGGDNNKVQMMKRKLSLTFVLLNRNDDSYNFLPALSDATSQQTQPTIARKLAKPSPILMLFFFFFFFNHKILHIHYGMQRAQDVHGAAARSEQGFAQRGRPQLAGCILRCAKYHFGAELGARRRRH
jgi:T-complex protein 1 gamma subunit